MKKRWLSFPIFLSFRFLGIVMLLILCLVVGGSIGIDSQSAKDTTPYLLTYPSYFGNRFTIPADNALTNEGVQLGRMLFYEPRLSATNQISCGSCHLQKLAFTDGRQFSQGVDGIPTRRNSMSLANLLWVRSFFWDGRSQGLEAQAIVPLTDPHEMGQSLDESCRKLSRISLYPLLFKKAFGSADITPERLSKAIAQFERTLISANSPYDLYLQGKYTPSPQQQHGMQLFMTGPSPQNKIRGANCVHCHGSGKMFLELFHNNGLDSIPADPGRGSISGSSADIGRFRIATLRNIALTAPYMHDGRFHTLEEVIDHYSEHLHVTENLSPFLKDVSNEVGGTKLLLTKQEKQDLISFLHMLTDSTFITNPELSNPHPAIGQARPSAR